ncbi:MAG: response regulator transcription factor [Candidatus Kapabacteria bacterium]|nr:response regulator transcription factor [Candidatus Kapabacteria bacterium]
MSMNLVLLEDEDIAMRKLRSMITELDRTATILAELSSVEEAMTWFQENMGRVKIDMIVSDIQLSDGLSFEVFEAFALAVPIVFTTAYNEYAVQAFSVHGLDYLLKPIRNDDLKRAFEKYHHNKLLYSGDALREVQRLLGEMHHARTTAHTAAPSSFGMPTFLASSGNRIIPLSAEKIAYFFMKNQLVWAMYDHKQEYALDETLEEIEARLPPQSFFRANRQYIIHRKAILSADAYYGSRLLVHLQPSAQEAVIISREKVGVFKAWLRGM